MNKFKIGDIVYYIGNEEKSLQKNIPYYVKYLGINVMGVQNGNVVIHRKYENFITEEEYKKFSSKSFKNGDLVYYVGSGQQLKKDTVYQIIFISFNGIYEGEKQYNLTLKSQTGQIYADFNSRNFVLKSEYGKEKSIQKPDETNKNLKSDSEIRFQIFKDTKEGKLKWDKPYPYLDEYFRSTLKIEGLENGYIRFDLKRETEEWELYVYLHRNNVDQSIMIRKIRQTDTLITIANKIEKMIEEQSLKNKEI